MSGNDQDKYVVTDKINDFKHKQELTVDQVIMLGVVDRSEDGLTEHEIYEAISNLTEEERFEIISWGRELDLINLDDLDEEEV